MGRGVFAAEPIRRGRLIEACPVVPLARGEEEDAAGKTLESYLFEWGGDGDQYCLALGYGSLYNHSAAPNASFEADPERARIVFRAVRDIPKGRQIFIDYGWEAGDYHFPNGK
jgi:SET domain-containing protein